MKRVEICFFVMTIWLLLNGSVAKAVDVGWIQQGVRVWYLGSGGSVPSSSDAEEAYLITAVSGNTAQLLHHSGVNHWSLPSAVTESGNINNQGPFWIYPQVLQTIAVGDKWNGIDITNIDRTVYSYDTFKSKSEFASIPYLLLPIKALFNISNQRQIVRIVYGIPYWPGYPVWGTAYFDADTGLCLFNLKLTVANTVWFLLSEINYDFATHQTFAEDNWPHTGFKSTITKTTAQANYMMIQSSVESRYGNTVQMWTNTSAGGSSSVYMPPDENYCFFGDVPVLKRKDMSAIPQYPPENWNEYGDYLWWWVPNGALQGASIDVLNVSMAKTATNPYTFSGSGSGTSLYYSSLVFDNDGYMTDFAARYPAIGLVINLGPSAAPGTPIHSVSGLSYYKGTMGNATPPVVNYRLALTVVSDSAGKGGGTVMDGDSINCSGLGSDPSGMSGTCQRDFVAGSIVNLSQSPDSDSRWASWSAAGCGTNQNCQLTMIGDRNVTVTFPYSSKAKLSSSGYGSETLVQAYGQAAQADTIYCRSVGFQEAFSLNGKKEITLMGGRDAWYQPQNAWTTLQGSLAVQDGSLTVDRLVVR